MKMTTKRLTNHFLTLLLTFLSFEALAEIGEIDDLTQVYELASEKAAEYGADNVLIVFDIDNTLLASKQNFGSDQWYEWQSDLIKKNELENAVATDITGLLTVQANLYSLGRMRTTQLNTSSIVSAIQEQGISVVALTARGPVNRDATLRELIANKIDMKRTSLGAGNGIAGRFFPLNPDHPHLYGLTKNEVLQFKLTKPRKISYEHGIIMVAGQHKGAMLRTILQRTFATPEVVIFIDDKEKNVRSIDDGLSPLGIEVFALRYSGEDQTVANFKASNKAKSIKAWEKLNTTLQIVFE